MSAIANLESDLLHRFRSLTSLGGESGTVHAADDLESGRRVAVRVFSDLGPAQAEAVLSHAAKAAQVRHPVFAELTAWGEAAGAVYVASELVDGAPLDGWADGVGIPPLPTVLELIRRLCFGLATAHRLGVGHDALMPHNLRVLPFTFGQDDRIAVKVLDLGLPVLRSRPLLDAERAQFLAPEQVVPVRGGWKSVPGLGEASSVYSLGALLSLLCSGGRPYRVRDVHALEVARAKGELPLLHRINPRVPAALTEIVHTAMAMDPQARFSSLSEMADALGFGALPSTRPAPTTGSRPAATTASEVPAYGLPAGYLDAVDDAIAAVMPDNDGGFDRGPGHDRDGLADGPSEGPASRITAIRPTARLRPSRAGAPAPPDPSETDSAAPMPPPCFQPEAGHDAASNPEADALAFDAEVDAAIAATLEPGPAGATEALSSRRLVLGTRARQWANRIGRGWRRWAAQWVRVANRLRRMLP